MCKYEMDPAGIAENTERTRFCPQNEQTDETDKVKPHALQFRTIGGYKNASKLYNTIFELSSCVFYHRRLKPLWYKGDPYLCRDNWFNNITATDVL